MHLSQHTRWYTSIQAKMILLSLIISLFPMLIIAEMTASSVTSKFDSNIEAWLAETSGMLLNGIDEAQREANAAIEFLVSHPEWLDQQPVQPPPSITKLISGFGYDLLVVYDEAHHLLYSTVEGNAMTEIYLDAVGSLYQVTFNGKTVWMAASSQYIKHHGQQYQIILGDWLDEHFMSTLQSLTLLDVGFFYENDQQFRRIYTSHAHFDHPVELDPDVVRQLRNGAPTVFVSATYVTGDQDEEYRQIYRALRDSRGHLTGIIYCGLRAREIPTQWIRHSDLFLSIFLTGMLLSMLAGLVVSRRFSQPLRALAHGVRRIASGEYDHRVRVQGVDEVAELAEAFNQMVAKLQEMRALEQQLRRHDRLSALGEVAVGIAHEVRNPLGSILTSAELVMRRTQLSATDAKLLGYVVDEVRRIDAMINEFLVFARPRAPILAPVDPAMVIERVCTFCAPELARQDILVHVQNDLPGARIQADADHLHQVCLNLMLNAIDAMASGGRLTIRIFSHLGHVAIAFADTGPGVPPELQERIFNPFFTTKPHGSGLGLAKVFAIMASHHGRVEYQSTAGGGAEFILIFLRGLEGIDANNPAG